jgi:hypothetical protein
MKLLALVTVVLASVLPSGHAHAAKSKGLCPQWREYAVSVGWKVRNLKTLDYIMHRESRCRPQALNTTLNRNGSWDYGLLQINDATWCKPSRYSAKGYLQTLRIVNNCKDLLDPTVNLVAALAVYEAAGNSFSPWGM